MPPSLAPAAALIVFMLGPRLFFAFALCILAVIAGSAVAALATWWMGAAAGGVIIAVSLVLIGSQLSATSRGISALTQQLARLGEPNAGAEQPGQPGVAGQPGQAGVGGLGGLGGGSQLSELAEGSGTSPMLEQLGREVRSLRVRLTAQMKELAKKTRNLESLIDGMDEPVLVAGDQDSIVLSNAAAETALAAGPGGLLGRRIGELFTRAELLELHRRAKAGQVSRGRVRLTTFQGIRTYQVSASPLPAAWGEGIFGVIFVLRDVTELAQAVQLQTDFVANASHELRTPVAALKAALETLEDGGRDDPVMLEKLTRMCTANVTRLEEMVRDLLDLSRLQSPDVPVRIAAVAVEELKATLHTSFDAVCQRRGLELRVEFDDGLTAMRTDVKLLSLILRNLIENATKFAHSGTTIRVVGKVVLDGISPVARFDVIDRGIGIPLDQQDRVFERFYQVDTARTGSKPQGRGSGLGLAIVKQTVDALRGRVGIESVYAEGTTVHVELPLYGN